jgi:uncharacterized membrane protein YphA (DoxX/SURF4 family)
MIPLRHGFWLALIRIYAGVVLFSHGFNKLMSQPPFNGPDGFLTKFLQDAVTKTSGPYHDFLATVVVPNTSTFGFLVEVGELCAGALLIVGLFTRLGALLAMFLVLNYWAAKGNYIGVSAYTTEDWLVFALAFVSLALPTGRFFGLDAFAGRRARKPPVVPQAPPSYAPPPYNPPPAQPPPYVPPASPPPR